MERSFVIEILPNFHPILVHFTIALFSTATALFLILALAGKHLPEKLREQWSIVARWNLWLGAAATIFTVLAGFYAFNTVAHDAPSHAAMSVHRNWAIASLILILSLAGWSIVQIRAGRSLGTFFVAALLVGQLVVLSTGWHGGELVYRYGLGVLSLPAAEAGDEGHGHGDDGSHGHAPTTEEDQDPASQETMGDTGSMPMGNEGGQSDVDMHSDEPHGHDDDHPHDGPDEH